MMNCNVKYFLKRYFQQLEISLFVLTVILCVSHPGQTGSAEFDIDSVISSMTVEEKIGQMFMTGGIGADKLKSGAIFKKYHFGNVFLGSADLKNLTLNDIARLNSELQRVSKKYNRSIPLLIATDQEGGRVNRLRKGFKLSPSQKRVGEKMDYTQAEKTAESVAEQMKKLGVNVNFSPVGDVNTNLKSHISKLGRSFSSDPERAGELSLAYLRGYSAGGVIGCLKHFPGYGDVSPDPHRFLPVTNKSYEEMERCELVPYIKCIKSGAVEMIMTAHIVVPALDGEVDIPATLSGKILGGILRNKLGFTGVIVTDDFNMGAIYKKGKDIREYSVRAVEAGVDILLFVAHYDNQIKARDAIYKAVMSGRIPMQRIDESVRRILLLKKLRVISTR
jgi:beta-N-acetylhexosaminidase